MKPCRFCIATVLIFLATSPTFADELSDNPASESVEPTADLEETPVPQVPKPEPEKTTKPADPKEDRDGVYVEAPEADASYWLLGEFVGEISNSESEGQNPVRIGLQLRAVGETDFDALMFDGGLPGEGMSFLDSDDVTAAEPDDDSQVDEESESPQPMRLLGRRSGEFLVLSGGPYAIFVDTDGCTLMDPAGKKLGRLDRVLRASTSLGAQPPEGAIVLFGDAENEGTEASTQHLAKAEITDQGWLKEGFTIKPMIQDFDLHAEFRLPYMPGFDDQKRGNSGIYIHSRYECQVLDSFAQDPKFNHLGSIYRFKAPRLNMALPPLAWQTYDIRFTSPRFNSDGSKFSDARLTMWVNGVKVQDDVPLSSQTGHGRDEEPILLPIHVQDHGAPVRYRNLWMIDRGVMQVPFPIAGDGGQPELDGDEVEEVDSSKAETAKPEVTVTTDSKPLTTPMIYENAQELPPPIVK